jgi:hypothetical protein
MNSDSSKPNPPAFEALDEEQQLRRTFLALVDVEHWCEGEGGANAKAMTGAKAMTLVGRYRSGLRKLDQSDPVVAFLTDQLQASLEQLPAKLWPQNFHDAARSAKGDVVKAARKTSKVRRVGGGNVLEMPAR